MIKKIESYFKAKFAYVVVVFSIEVIVILVFNWYESLIMIVILLILVYLTYDDFKVDPPKEEDNKWIKQYA